ncbi:L-ribulose-5-phosphate 3-epimerase [uncultured Brachyspira sp.]|uniref:L-ribulose-5-phosphate 3-epimerase n=1 Tax=uncultured Brachyspira sp. TaxID=221953 RepID=UPI00262D23AC|nr:L-ribulose-5-phosphate 3-epimerase [uncultured Brachyspira sp.]
MYEKALEKNTSWHQKLLDAKELGFDFVEISIDETDERLARLDWTKDERESLVKSIFETGIKIPTMCFSGHRRFPMGSKNSDTRKKAMELMEKAIIFASDIGIRIIQLAGYDVYYEKGDEETKQLFIDGLKKSLEMAAKYQVMLSIEIMDTHFLNSITKFLEYDKICNSPWLTVYPDLGNLTAWGNDVEDEIRKGIHKITAIHIKDTIAPKEGCEGKFKEVPFGEGCVDFVKCFKLLKELNYNGTFMIEMWSEKSDNPKEYVMKEKKWVLEKMKEGGFY